MITFSFKNFKKRSGYKYKLALKCCFASNFGWPGKLIALFPSIVCVILLLIHRKATKDWEMPFDSWAEGFKFPFFMISLFFCTFIVAMLFVLHEADTTEIVACISVALVSFIGHSRKKNYTQDWIGGEIS